MATLHCLAATYVSERFRSGELAAESARSIGYSLSTFCDHVGPVAPARLRPEHVERWMIETTMAPETARAALSRVRVWSRWMVRRGHLGKDPTLDIRGPKRPRQVPRGLRLEAVEAVLAVCPDTRSVLLTLAMVQEGMRCCEVAGLQRGDVDFTERLVVVTGKGRHERVLPLSGDSWAAMRSYLSEVPGHAGPLIRSQTNPYMGISARRVSGIVNRLFREAGVPSTAHALRHTAATDALRAGAHLRDVQAMMGHVSLSTTQRYLPWLVGDLRTAMGGRNYLRPKLVCPELDPQGP